MGYRVLIFAKEKPGLEEAIKYLKNTFAEVIVYKGTRGDPFPKEAYGICPDMTISYLSPWIIPKVILQETKKWAINFHSGPPEYPGIGCTNFAIYNGEKKYGITAHLMETKVDTGKIIQVKRFPILKDESVLSLTVRCYQMILVVFRELLGYIVQHDRLPDCHEKWSRVPYTRKELNALCKIDLTMDKKEVKRRVKSTYYPGMPGAYIDFAGFKFVYQRDNDSCENH